MRKMKDSGVEWIGEIPSDWTICKILYVLKMPLTDGPHTTPEMFDDGVPFVSAEAVSCGNGRIDFDHIRGYISEEFYQECCKKYIPQINDIYMIKSGATTGKVAIVDTDRKFTIWSPLAVFRSNEKKVKSKYMFYYLQSSGFQKQVELSWSFGTQQNIGMRALERLSISVPPLAEQKKIADFLDEKCGEIDSIKADVQRQIGLLNDYKKSVITEAVTKGLNPKAKLKDSSIEWIGKIPDHWEVKKTKYCFEFGKGLPITKENLEDSGISVISYGQIHSKQNNGTSVNSSLIRFVNESYLRTNPLSLVHKNDFIFADTSEDLDGCGNCVYIDTKEPIFAGYHTIIFRSKQPDAKYFAYLFLTDCWRSQIRKVASGVKLFSITQKILKETSVIIPPLSEQKEIADYLDEKCSEIDAVIADKQKQLETLDEYKKSLIFEYVTGKKEVVQ